MSLDFISQIMQRKSAAGTKSGWKQLIHERAKNCQDLFAEDSCLTGRNSAQLSKLPGAPKN